MQSIFGALLAAGHAAAANATIQAASGTSQDVSNSIQTQLVRSFGGAETIAAQYPQYATAITAAAKASFLAGDQWAYLAGYRGVPARCLVLGVLLLSLTGGRKKPCSRVFRRRTPCRQSFLWHPHKRRLAG